MKDQNEFKETPLGKFLAVLLAIMVLLGVMVLLSSCASKWPTCPSYGSVTPGPIFFAQYDDENHQNLQ